MKAILNDYEPKEIAKMMREWIGKTQEEFAPTVNRTSSSIIKIENGDRNLYLHTFLEWAKIHGIKVTMEKENKK